MDLMPTFGQHELKPGEGTSDFEDPRRPEPLDLVKRPRVLVAPRRGVRLESERTPDPVHLGAPKHRHTKPPWKAIDVVEQLLTPAPIEGADKRSATPRSAPLRIPILVLGRQLLSGEHALMLAPIIHGATRADSSQPRLFTHGKPRAPRNLPTGWDWKTPFLDSPRGEGLRSALRQGFSRRRRSCPRVVARPMPTSAATNAAAGVRSASSSFAPERHTFPSQRTRQRSRALVDDRPAIASRPPEALSDLCAGHARATPPIMPVPGRQSCGRPDDAVAEVPARSIVASRPVRTGSQPATSVLVPVQCRSESWLSSPCRPGGRTTWEPPPLLASRP